ncbi:SCO family protein [Puia sp.]|jgi:protein SCO1/2|uniref:SCO family protein n=1 Tax=Puia sp. TaxID=2045100 RepID=UPI002F4094D3
MNKKGWLAVFVAVVVPLGFYFVAKQYSVAMPRHYFPDSVVTRMQDGKQVNDTIWHKVANLRLQNQLGDTVSLDSLRGKVIIIDFFFTHCASICPILTRNMRHLQDALKLKDYTKRVDTTFVKFISLTVDPAHDSPAVMKRYADHYGVNSDVWWMLTGPKKTIYDFALNELKLGLQDSVSVDSNFVHTDYVALLDKNRVIRGYYHGTDTAAMAKLSDDIVFVMLEKDKNHKSTAFDELRPLLLPIILILLGTVLAVVYFSRKKLS